MLKMFTSWQAFALASAFFAGLTAIFGKLGVARLNSNLATFIRTLVILGVISLILTWRNEWETPKNLPAKDAAFLVLSGIATGLSWLCYYRALQMAPASKVAPVDKLSVAFAVLLAVLFLGEALTWQVATGACLIVAGAVIMTL
jgi:bacterial/archaeal transporter family protein